MPKSTKTTLKSKHKKVVVFDLDETLGCFEELGTLCTLIDEYHGGKQKSYSMFNDLLDLYPEFIRPQIITILKYLLHKRKEHKCKYIMIYTNNQGERAWVEHIKAYFEKKLNSKIFEQIISAFKVDGKIVELHRTTHDKTVDDFFRCTKLPRDIEICFVDDLFHPRMEDDNVYYIHVKAYKHYIPSSILVDRFMKSHLIKNIKDKEEFKSFLLSNMKYNIMEKSKEEQDVDVIVSKKLLEHIKDFFEKDENNNEEDSDGDGHDKTSQPHHFDVTGKRKSFKKKNNSKNTNTTAHRNRTLKKKI